MTLPPGTFGWVGSGFDCTCECNFDAGFAYADGELVTLMRLDSRCLLMFGVGNLRNGCTPIDIATADLTVELFRNGIPITEPLIPIPGLNGLYWEKWKPTAGDVYTATVTLTCGTTIVIREYTITIPTPANTECVCCDDRIPDYAVVSGLTGACCTFANGTFGLSQTAACVYQASATFAAPADGCGGGHCFTCSQFRAPGIPNDIFYYFPREVIVTASIGTNPFLPSGPVIGANQILVRVIMFYWVYRLRDGICSDGSGVFSCAGGNVWWFLSECAAGPFTLHTGPGFGAICLGQTPNIELAFA
jgi:hypothetical protein